MDERSLDPVLNYSGTPFSIQFDYNQFAVTPP